MKIFDLRVVRGHTFIGSHLDSSSVVVDCGAHRGEFSASILTTYGCKCYLIEANPVLASAIDIHGVQTVYHGAVSAHDGEAVFVFQENPESGGLASVAEGNLGNGTRIRTISLTSFMRLMKLEEIDLLKLDVEGAEFELLMSEPIQTLQKVKQITVEFHDFMPRFRVGRPYEKCMAKLEQAGFVPIQMAFRTHGDVLLLNKMHFRDSFLRLLMMRLLGRFVKKLGMLS